MRKNNKKYFTAEEIKSMVLTEKNFHVLQIKLAKRRHLLQKLEVQFLERDLEVSEYLNENHEIRDYY